MSRLKQQQAHVPKSALDWGTGKCCNQNAPSSASSMKGRNRGLAQRGSTVSFGEFGAQGHGSWSS